MTQDMVDLEVVLRHYWRRHHKRIIAVGVVLVLLWASSSMFYKVEADSEGVVLRLGKLSKTTTSGLHFKLPWPIDTVQTVPVHRVQSLEFGYRTIAAGRRTQYARPGEQDQTMARMLTGDLNLAHVEWVVQYQIKDPEDHLFRIGGEGRSSPENNARDLIQDVSEAVMRRIIGDVSVDTVITTGREQIASDTKNEMQQWLDSFEAGIKVVAVKLQSAAPPDPVKDAFDAVNRAKQSKERVVNEAKGERNRLIPAARGGRDRAIAEAEGYALRTVQEAQGRASAFLARLTEYDKAPQITKTR
ncbi:MAG: FtsH protease activity modulator HflK, partial [Planctomycetota bacterium]